MSTSQSEVYECARANGLKLGNKNNEWINFFSDGIKVSKGDTIRILGSFVHEGDSGDNIEVVGDQTLNINYSPFIKCSTIATANKDSNILDLSMMGDLAYSTDSFGIEPPLRIDPRLEDELTVPNYQYITTPFTPGGNVLQNPNADLAYQNPVATGYTANSNYGLNDASRFFIPPTTATNSLDDGKPFQIKANTFGTNMKTDSFEPGVTTNPSPTKGLDYDIFRKNNGNAEMYMSQLVKKFILPVFDSVSHTDEEITTTHTLEDLVVDPPVQGSGIMAGAPRAGMYVMTVDIAASSGWWDEKGNGYYENTWGAYNAATPPNYEGTDLEPTGGYAGGAQNTGIPNLKSGSQSVLGEIIAVRPIKMNVMGRTTPCYECYVSNFINPAQIQKRKLPHPFRIGELSQGSNFYNNKTAITAYKQIHGSGQNEFNYNYNPSINNVNGAYAQASCGAQGGTRLAMAGVPSENVYTGDGANGDFFSPGASADEPTDYDKGYGMPQGLSFLWNGSYGGYMRYQWEGSINQTAGTDHYSVAIRTRANSNLIWSRRPNMELRVNLEIYNNIVATSNPQGGDQSSAPMPASTNALPVCLGAFVCVKKETALAIARGEYVSENDPGNLFYSGQAGRTPRIWFDWSYQQSTSDYTTRHYGYNNFNKTDAGNGQLDHADATQYPAANEVRHGYQFCGQPLNINWRGSSSYANAGALHEQYLLAGGTASGYPNSGENFQDPAIASDGSPMYFSTTDGTKAPGINGSAGAPYIWGGYNTTTNSLYFQDKSSGDTSLGLKTLLANTQAPALATNLAVSNTLITMNQNLADQNGNAFVPAVGDHIQIILDHCQFDPTTRIDNVAIIGATYSLTLQKRMWVDVPQGTSLIISRGRGHKLPGVGRNGVPWTADLLWIKEYTTQIKLSGGFYTEEQLASTINTQLHYTNEKYREFYQDDTGALPTNIGLKEQALCSRPAVLNGPFLISYLPDVTYGFSPVTETNATALDLDASTKEITDQLITYDPIIDPDTGLIQHDWATEIETRRPVNTTTSRYITTTTAQTTSLIGNHNKFYTIPSVTTDYSVNPQLHLIRMRGGALNLSDFTAADGAGNPAKWDNRISRFVGAYEMLMTTMSENTTPSFSTNSRFSYRTRLNRNLFPYGGSSRLFCGANNVTFSFEESKNRFSLNNLYMPIRPHAPPNGKDQQGNDFGIDDAVPSAIINSKSVGNTVGLLTGIYINDITGGAFTQSAYGVPTIGDNYQYDTLTDGESQEAGESFLNTMGFTKEQLDRFNNSFDTNGDLFVFVSDTIKTGTAIRVGPKINIAVNGTNPFASACLNLAPVQQFMVEVSTDDFFADRIASKGSDPYYYITSSFPSKKFYGEEVGQHLPVIGINARNFHAFNFSFDLGSSSITYTMEEDAVVTHIRTCLYTSRMKVPTQLSENSSVIYLITRNNYVKNLTPQQGEIADQIMAAGAVAPMVGDFYSPPTGFIRSIPPLNIPPNYFTGFGQMDTSYESDEDDE